MSNAVFSIGLLKLCKATIKKYITTTNDDEFIYMNITRPMFLQNAQFIDSETSPLLKWHDEIRRSQTDYYLQPYFMRSNPRITDLMVINQYTHGV